MIDLKEMSFSYGKSRKGEKPLFDQLTLELGPGLFGLLGKNGAGKTTLMRIMAGLIYPHEGKCEVMEQVPGMRNPSLLEEIFFLSEEFYLPGMTGEEYRKMYSPFYPKFDHNFFDRCCREFEIEINKKLSKMSYGQKKKYLIAFGLASKTKLLLLDEPTNGLDIPSKAQFRKLVAASWSEEQTIVISTHQVRDVEKLIDPIIIVDNGKIIFKHSLEEINHALKFSVYSHEEEGDRILYSEKGLGGWAVMEAGPDEAGGAVDLELLFNGVLNDPKRISGLMKGVRV
ncbi:MAG: ABC transporter ATP-binding protein [Spirochaetales bacterium]|nr:ABC transporter ATP-binding protein [Spirochaetales bacterium]